MISVLGWINCVRKVDATKCFFAYFLEHGSFAAAQQTASKHSQSPPMHVLCSEIQKSLSRMHSKCDDEKDKFSTANAQSSSRVMTAYLSYGNLWFLCGKIVYTAPSVGNSTCWIFHLARMVIYRIFRSHKFRLLRNRPSSSNPNSVRWLPAWGCHVNGDSSDHAI